MKYLLMILLVIPILLIDIMYAQPVEEEIKLPDIIIHGETEKLIDTISLEERLRPYWDLHSLEEFEYEPFLEPEPLTPYEEYIREKKGLLSMHFGNRRHLTARALYRLPHNSFLSFYAGFEHKEIVKERVSRFFRTGWLPSYRETDYAAEINYSFFTDKEEDHALLEEEPETLYELEHYGFSLSMQRDDAGRIALPVKDIYLRVALNRYQQDIFLWESTEKYTAHDLDLHTRMTFLLDETDLVVPLEFVLVKGTTPGIHTGVRREYFLFLDQLGFDVVADRYAIIPSLSFRGRRDFNNFLRVIVANEPEIDTRTRLDFLKDNPDQQLDMEKRLIKTPLNASLILENDRLTPLSLSYRIRWHKDYLYYTAGEAFLFSNRTDLLENQIAFTLAYRYRDLQMVNRLEYRHLDKEIFFIPDLHNRTTIGWYADNFQIWSDFDLIAGRKRDANNKMENVGLLSLSARKLVINNLSAEIAFHNILQQSYRKYDTEYPEVVTSETKINHIPEEPFRFKAGLIWRF